MIKPLVCICVPTYNAEKTIAETLSSIFAQTYDNIVVHVVDNASTDNTLEVVASFDDPRLHVHGYDENVGGEGNFTRCVQLAEGEYTAIFHADDVYDPTIVEKQVNVLNDNPSVGSVFTKARTIDEHGKVTGMIGHVPDGMAGVPIGFEKLLKLMLLHHNFLVCPSVLVRTDIYKNKIKVWGGSLFKSASDIDTWLRLSEIKPIVVLDEALMNYRISSVQFSDRIRNRIKRTDFFLVMDHYLARSDVRKFLTEKDFRHYGWLERHEAVACAINLTKLGKEKEAKSLLKNIFCWDAFYAALCTKRGRDTLLAGIALYILVGTGLGERFYSLINFLKNYNR